MELMCFLMFRPYRNFHDPIHIAHSQTVSTLGISRILTSMSLLLYLFIGNLLWKQARLVLTQSHR